VQVREGAQINLLLKFIWVNKALVMLREGVRFAPVALRVRKVEEKRKPIRNPLGS
jgi:hypothetical protein